MTWEAVVGRGKKFPANLRAVVLKLQLHQKHLERLLEHSLLGSAPGVTDSVGLGCGPQILISKNFPVEVAAASPHTILREP